MTKKAENTISLTSRSLRRAFMKMFKKKGGKAPQVHLTKAQVIEKLVPAKKKAPKRVSTPKVAKATKSRKKVG